MNFDATSWMKKLRSTITTFRKGIYWRKNTKFSFIPLNALKNFLMRSVQQIRQVLCSCSRTRICSREAASAVLALLNSVLWILWTRVELV